MENQPSNNLFIENPDLAGPSHHRANSPFEEHLDLQYVASDSEKSGSNKRDESDVERSETSDESDEERSGASDESDSVASNESDDSSSEEDWDIPDNFSFMPELLHRDSKHTTGEAIRQLLELYSKHAVTKLCLKDLVQLIHNLLPSGNNFPKSYYFLKKNIEPFIPPKLASVHLVCEACGTYICEFKRGLNVQCPACMGSKTVKFQDLNISTEIKYLFEKRHLADAIDRYRDSEHSDITKSEEYIRVKTNLHGPYDIVLHWNFDGVAVQKSNSDELWPVMFNICEVAPQERSSFTMVAGLWHNKKNPTMNAYLIPFTKHLQDLAKNGVKWVHPRTGKTYISKVVAPVLSVDARARAKGQHLHTHSGEYSCTVCEIKGETLILGPRSHKLIFKFPEEPDPLRTKDAMRQYADQATEENVIVKGVKGPSILDSIPECDSSKSLVLEYMHLVLLGICRQFFTLWFTTSGTDWYVGRLGRLTRFLKNIKRLYETPRCPSDASKWKMFKAQTWRVWLLFVSLPALHGRLKDKYFQHWCLFVAGISTLLKESVTEQDLQLAEILLSLFVQDAQQLYGLTEMSHNLHGVLHLVLMVRRWGALWATSAFKFEGMNGILSRLLHGTVLLSTELTNTLSIIMASQTLNHLMKPQARRFGSRPNELISPCKPFELAVEERNALRLALGNVDALKYFYRAYINSRLCTSELYTNERATDNRTVCFMLATGKSYGIVRFYIQSDQEMFALIRSFDVEVDRYFKNDEVNVIIDHIIPIRITDALHVVPLNDILSKVFAVDTYVCIDPNRFEQYL